MTAKNHFLRRTSLNAVICGVLCLLMLLGLALLTTTDTHAATATASGTCGDDLTWNLDSEGTLTISGSGKMTDWSSYSSVPWYENYTSVKKIVICDGVTTVGNYAFYHCSRATSVTIPDGVTSIGAKAFENCGALNVTLNSASIALAVTSSDACGNCKQSLDCSREIRHNEHR